MDQGGSPQSNTSSNQVAAQQIGVAPIPTTAPIPSPQPIIRPTIATPANVPTTPNVAPGPKSPALLENPLSRPPIPHAPSADSAADEHPTLSSATDDLSILTAESGQPAATSQIDARIKTILTQKSHMSEQDLHRAEHFALTHRITLLDYAVSQNLISKDDLGQALAQSFGIGYADLEKYQPTKQQIGRIPPEIGQQCRAFVFREDKQSVIVATDRPSDPALVPQLQSVIPGKTVTLAYAMPDDIEPLLVYYRKPLVTRFTQIISQQQRVAPEIIDEIIKDAIAYKVSDIHIEPEETVVVIRFRIDGLLQEAGQLPKQYYDNILNRLKVQAHMRIDEHGSSQDGAIRYVVDEQPVDIRISIVPTLDGEKVALRLLAEYSRNLSFKNLGLNVLDLKIINDQAHRPFGMIITTGPTGSGKTTTLYALLKILNKPDINVTTIEDPVEYKIFGVNQIQVNARTDLTFSQGLRTIVRQDPDIILVGEIRDTETAKLAVNAALTGHLLLSTFHANDAATAIPRLIDMGVEPFLLASTLNVVIAQRLVRTIHDACRGSYEVSLDELKFKLPAAEHYFKTPKVTLYYGRGCEACNFTGFKGRTAIYELLNITPAIKELILHNPSTEQIWQLARREGARSLFEDGLDKVQTGRTTLEELLRVAEPK